MAASSLGEKDGSDPMTDDEIRDWFRRLLLGWRSEWDRADVATRERLAPMTSPTSLLRPSHFCVYILRGQTAPIEAASVIVHHDTGRPDGEVRFLHIPEDSTLLPSGDAPAEGDAISETRRVWAEMRRNWTPGRGVDGPSPRGMPFRWIRGPEPGSASTLWVLDGSFEQVPVEEVVAWSLASARLAPQNSPQPVPPEMIAAPHIYDAGMDRERFAVSRWLGGPCGGEELFPALGMRGASWWCGIGLNRSDIFGEKLDGDVDLIAGPIEFVMTPEEFDARVDELAKQKPLTTPRGAHAEAVWHAAAREGRILWPPRIETIVACEAKASGFDADDESMKAPQLGKGKRVKGQLDVLLKRGVNRVAFLHLVASRAVESANVNPWFAAAAAASRATANLERIFEPADRPTCGYFTVAMGAVAHKTEEFSGSGGRLNVVQESKPNASSGEEPWRKHLQEKLGSLPRPTAWRFFVLPCGQCGKWCQYSGPSLQPSCGCSRQ